jgi:hypothetical protein
MVIDYFFKHLNLNQNLNINNSAHKIAERVIFGVHMGNLKYI